MNTPNPQTPTQAPTTPKADTGSIDAIAASMVVDPRKNRQQPSRSSARTAIEHNDAAGGAAGLSDQSPTEPVAGVREQRDRAAQRQDDPDADLYDELHQADDTDADDAAPDDEDGSILDTTPTPTDAEDESPDDESDDDTLDTSKSYADVGDDALIRVKVDGVEQDVTIADLKKRYAGEGAIERRLHEATEARKAAFESYETGKRVVQTALQTMGQALFRRMVPPPDENLRVTNPTQYLLQKEAFETEGKALMQQHGVLQQAVAAADAYYADIAKKQRADAAIALRKALPVLADPKKGPIVKQRIIETAKAYGFKDSEIAEAIDTRLFVLVRDLARYRQMNGKTQVLKDTPKTRTLPKTASANKSPASSFQKQHAAAKQRAKQSGSVDDVAATMVVAMKPKRR